LAIGDGRTITRLMINQWFNLVTGAEWASLRFAAKHPFSLGIPFLPLLGKKRWINPDALNLSRT
jgi:hypothetical protein